MSGGFPVAFVVKVASFAHLSMWVWRNWIKGECDNWSTSFPEYQSLGARSLNDCTHLVVINALFFVFIFNSLACLCSFQHFHLISFPTMCFLASDPSFCIGNLAFKFCFEKPTLVPQLNYTCRIKRTKSKQVTFWSPGVDGHCALWADLQKACEEPF